MFSWIHALARCVGHTHAACGHSRQHTVICVSEKEAARLRKTYGVKAVGLERAPFEVLRSKTPIVFDTEVVRYIVATYEDALHTARLEKS